MSCPNVNSAAWKDLVAKIGTFDAMKEFIRNNEEIPDARGYQESFKGVNATMKIVTALQKLKRNSYPSNSIQGFYNDLIKQGAPKNQIDLLKEHIAQNNIIDINTNDLITSLLSEMSYTVEINTAKDINRKDIRDSYNDSEKYFDYDGYQYLVDDYYEEEGAMRYTKSEIGNLRNSVKISKKEFDNAAEKAGFERSTNTQHYANMTVPGGTNYTENEIATPQIIPSIKGHAQFATENGIGWFRSDEKIVSGSEGPRVSDGAGGLVRTSVSEKTTRRILEVQSDLFQKGRDKDNLVSGITEQDLIDDYHDGAFENYREYKEAINGLLNKPENQFLQLLNKENNWVTFFVKSIIQDSAKKGYEKVLFPLGNTAAKVEGHDTLEGYIKYREDKIQKNREVLNRIENKINFTWNDMYYDFENKLVDGETSELITFEEDVNSVKTTLTNESNQFERELGEAQDGTMKFSSIANFYENTVTNILKKQGYSPTKVKDEYGNEWNEVELTPEIAKELISFNKEEKNTAFESQLIKYLQDKDIIAKKEFPAGSGNLYIKKTTLGQDRNSYMPEEVERRNINKILEINQALGFEAIQTTKIGNGLVISINSQLALFDRFDEDFLNLPKVAPGDIEFLDENVYTENAADLVDNVYRLSMMFNKQDMINIGNILKDNENLLSGVTIEILNNEDLTEQAQEFINQSDVTASYHAAENKIYLYKDKLNAYPVEKTIRIIMEELLHALTVQPFHKRDNNIPLKAHEQEFVDNISKLYNYYKSKAHQYLKKDYRFINEREFIIGMTLDANFKDHLEYIDEGNPGFFEKMISDFINAVLKFFGYKTSQKIQPFEKLTINYINQYISNVNEITPLKVGKNVSDNARDIRTEKEELKNSLTEAQKNKIKDKIKTFVNQIKSISGTSRASNPDIKNALFHIHKDYTKFTEDDIDQIDFFFNFSRELNSIFDSLNRQINELNKNDRLEDKDRLYRWNKIISTARDFDSTLQEFKKLKAELFDDELIAKDIDNLISKRSNIEDKYFLSITPLVVTHLSDIIEPATEKALAYLDDEISILNNRIELATKSGAEKRAKDLQKTVNAKIKEREDKYNITTERVHDYIRGLMGDSSTLSSFLEASIVSGNPIVSGLTKYIKDSLHKSDAAILDTANEVQTELELYEKNSGISRNNLEAFNRPLLDTYEIIQEIDDDLNITTKKKLSLLSPWNLDYIKELQKFTFINNKLKDKLKNSTSEADSIKLKQQLKDNTVKRLQFLRDYMEMPYLKEVHEALDLIHEDLGGFTAYEAIGALYDEKERIEEEIERTKDEDVKDILYNNLDNVEFRIKEIRTTYEKDPDSKEYKVAAQLRKRDETLKKYRKFVLTKSGEAKFKLEKERTDTAFETGEITKKERDQWYQRNTVNGLSEDYWKTKMDIISKMNDLLTEMGVVQEKDEDVGKLYKDIENIVKPYRDANGVIQGNKFNQKQVQDIKQLEETIEELKNSLANVFGLTKNERIEVANLNEEFDNNDVEMQSEYDPARVEFLKNEQIRIEKRIEEINSKKKKFAKKLLNRYFTLMKKLSALDKTSETHYYTERYQEEFDKHVERQSIKGMGDKFVNEKITYEKISNAWYAKTKNKSTKITKSEAEKVYKTKKADETFDQSDWYRNNHTIKMEWEQDEEQDYDTFLYRGTTGTWNEVYKPIYIWRQTEPTDPKHKISEQPALQYKRAIIKNGRNDDNKPDGSEDFTNPNYKQGINGYNLPKYVGAKDDRYINKKYLELANATDSVSKAKFRYLNYHTDLYNRAQEESYIPRTMRPGFDMPSVRPSTQERIQATSVSEKISTVGQWLRGVTDEVAQNEQDKDILYGYLDNKGMIPMKFLGEIDIEDQSIDIARSVGMFYIAAQQRMRLGETWALVTSTQDILAQKENTPTKIDKDGKTVAVAKKYLNKSTKVAKHITGTNKTLNQVNEMISTFYFGEKIKDEKGSKQLNTVLGFGANLMLGLNFGSMIQNWSNAKIQSILEGEATLTKNFTTKTWFKAEATYWAHIGELMGDLGKYGNKSYINQFIDYFGGINFNIINTFNTTSAYKGLTNSIAKTLMPTEIAEHQLSHVLFMSIAMNTKVKMNDEEISLFEAFRIGDKGLEIKEGVDLTQTQRDDFINRVNSSARRINGEYGNLDSPIAQKFMLGRLFLFMNKYAVPFFMRRFGKRRFNIQDGIQDDGYWRTFFKTLGHDIRTFQINIVKNWKYYTPSEKASVKQVGTEISISLVIMSMIAMLGGDDDKELKDNGLLANNIIYILKGIKRQNEQFMLVPGLGLDDVYNRIRNPFPIATKLGQAFAVLNDVVYLAGYSMNLTELKDIQYTKKSGWHNKGDLKIWADFSKLIAGPNRLQQILHPDIAIKNLDAYRIK